MGGETIADLEASLPDTTGEGTDTGVSEDASAEMDWLNDETLYADDGDLDNNEVVADETVPPVVADEPPVIQAPVKTDAPTPAAVAPVVTDAPVVEEAAPAVITPEQQAEQRANYLSSVETSFELSEDDRVAMVTEPEKVLPRLAAQVHLRTLEQVAQLLPAVIEAQVQNMVQRQAVIMEGVQAFFGEWPELQAHAADAAKALTVFRQSNPNLTREQLIEQAGAFVAQQKGLQLLPKSKRAAAPAPAGNNRRPAPPPGGNGKSQGAAPSAAPAKKTVWEELADDE